MKKLFDFKSLCIGIVTGSLLFGGIVGASTLITDNVYLNKYAVTVDGKDYTPTAPLLNYAGTTYVPLREFGTITGANVSFSNNTIVVKKPTAATSTPSAGTTTPSTGATTTSKLNGTKMEIDVGSKDSFYVDLNAYGSKSASISISSGTSYISLAKKSLTASGLVEVNGLKAGSATIKVAYNNGYTDVISVTVEGNDVIEIDSGDYDYIEIDLEEYDADKATLSISSGKDYISLGKTEVTKSTDVKVTGKKAGEATVKVKYDSGDTVYFDIVVNKSSSSASDDEIEVDIDCFDGKFVYYIDLDEWDADEAEISVDDDDDCIKVNKTTFTSNGTLTITGLDEGEAEVEIEFYDEDGDDIDSFIIYVNVLDDSDFDPDDYDFEDELEIDLDDYDEITVDPDDYDADWATISIITGTDYTSVSKTYVTAEKDIEIDGDDEGEAIIQITYSTGDVEYYYIEVVD